MPSTIQEAEGPSRYQVLYWNQMVTIKSNVFYLEAYREDSGWYDSAIKMTLAIASSSAIGAWVIWKHLDFVWAALIAASQVIGAINGYLPYRRRIALLNGVANQLETLFIKAEEQWFEVERGILTDAQINRKYIALKSQSHQIMVKAFGSHVLPRKNRLVDLARQRTEEFFSSNFVGESKDDG